MSRPFEGPVLWTNMNDVERLRPLERRIRRLVEQGQPHDEIAQRFHRSPEFIERVLELSELHRAPQPPAPSPSTARSTPLRPLERRTLRWRAEGFGYAEIGELFRRGPAHVEQVERLANYKLSR